MALCAGAVAAQDVVLMKARGAQVTDRDVKAEMQRIADETAQKAKDAAANSPSSPDFQKLLNGGGNDDNDDSE